MGEKSNLTQKMSGEGERYNPTLTPGFGDPRPGTKGGGGGLNTSNRHHNKRGEIRLRENASFNI